MPVLCRYQGGTVKKERAACCKGGGGLESVQSALKVLALRHASVPLLLSLDFVFCDLERREGLRRGGICSMRLMRVEGAKEGLLSLLLLLLKCFSLLRA